MKFETKAVHIGEEPNLKEGGCGDVVFPIHLSTTFARREVDKPTSGFEYSRTRNPTREALEKRLAALENARFALACSSGMAAEWVVALSVLKTGDHVIASEDLYGGTKRLFQNILDPNFRVSFSYLDLRNPEQIRLGFQKKTKLVWLESPTNPMMRLCDIRAIARLAHEKKVLVAVDNTFLSPYFQNPLDLGADIVVHSTTKYLNGHSDSIGGAIMVSDKKLYQTLKSNHNAMGGILSPFDSYLVLRGIKTLALRMEKHQENALKIARFLRGHPKVRDVFHPGLKTHPQYLLARKQTRGSGGTFSFTLNGSLAKARRFLKNLRLFSLGESLGGVESLIEHPATMTHSAIPRAEKEKLGINDSLIRVSVGIENFEDLIRDLKTALRKI